MAMHWQQAGNCIGSEHPPELPKVPTMACRRCKVEPHSEVTAVAMHWYEEAICIGSEHPPEYPKIPTHVVSEPPFNVLSGESAPQAFCAPPPAQPPAEPGM